MAPRCFTIYAPSGEVPFIRSCFGTINLTDPPSKRCICLRLQTFPSLSPDKYIRRRGRGNKRHLIEHSSFRDGSQFKSTPYKCFRNSDRYLVSVGRGKRVDGSSNTHSLNVLQDQVSSDTFSLVLQDASIILRPRAVVEVMAVMEPDGLGNSSPESHPNQMILRVLSDMARLYGHDNPGRSTRERRDAATSHKLGFYAARVVCMPAMTLRVLADEVFARSKLIVLESGGGEQTEGVSSPSTRTTPVRPRPIIEEL